MEYAVWTLVLLMGAIWTHMSTPSWTQNPLDWEVFVRRAVDDSIITKCDFEDDSKPLCDWSQVSADDGDWIRASGPSPTGISGPPGGYPSGEGYYLHMDSRTFRTGGVARLRSPDIWEHGPLCLYFAYHMFGLSWGAQLRLLLLMGTQDNRPKVLWKHVNTQSPSWMPTTVSLPAELILPSRLIFEGMRGNTPFLDISLDALSIHRGTCNRVCMMKMCTFDVLNDLCGWSWIPTATGAKWVQKNGSSGKPGVGPEDDFSSPGHGFYMLLDPKNAKPGQKSVLLSPLSQSDGCLTLSFNYILWGHSLDAALLVYASLLGNIRKHTIFSGQPGPTWKPVSVNYTGQGQIQFTVVGIFGIIPEPSVAVDAISIAPCGESFPHCDFEDSAHPFCDWTHVFSDGGHWAWGSKNLPTIVGGSADSTYGGEHYIYFEADKFSRAGQSVRLGSRPFCAPGDICVEFAYHMNGLGKGSMLKFLLGSPAGSSPVTLWHRVGAQGPGWLNSSVTVPSGYQQPMQLFFEATRGSNSAFLVAVRFIKISHRICGEVTTTAAPTLAVSPTRPAVAPTSTMTPTGKPTVPMEKPVVLTEKPSFSIKKPTHSTEKPLASTEKPIPVEVATSPAVAVPATVELAISPAEASTSLAEAGPTPAEAAPTPAEAAPMPAETGPTPAEAVPAPEEAGPLPAEAGPSPVGAVPTPAEAATSLAGTATFPVEAGPTPAEASTSPAEAATSPAETATFPTEAATSPAETATFPTEAGTSPAETATSLAETEPTPAEAGTSPAEAATSPAEAVTSPVEAGPTPAEAGTSPALTATFSAEAGTTQAEAGTSPVEAAPAPAEARQPLREQRQAQQEYRQPLQEQNQALKEQNQALREREQRQALREQEQYQVLRDREQRQALREQEQYQALREREQRQALREQEQYQVLRDREQRQALREREQRQALREREQCQALGEQEERQALREREQHQALGDREQRQALREWEQHQALGDREQEERELRQALREREQHQALRDREQRQALREREQRQAQREREQHQALKEQRQAQREREQRQALWEREQHQALKEQRQALREREQRQAQREREQRQALREREQHQALKEQRQALQEYHQALGEPEQHQAPGEQEQHQALREYHQALQEQEQCQALREPKQHQALQEYHQALRELEQCQALRDRGQHQALRDQEQRQAQGEQEQPRQQQNQLRLNEMTTTTGALIVPLETTTAMTMVLTETTAEMTMVLTEMTTQTTIFPTQAVTESTTVQFEVPMASVGATTEIATIPTENPAVLTEKPTIPILMPMIPTEKPTVPTERPVVPTEKPIGLTERPVVPIEKPTVPTEKPMVPTERPIVLTEKPVVPIERPTGPTEKPTVPIERPTAPIEKPVVPTEKPTVPTERSTVPTEKPTVPTERPTASTERSTAPTERPVVPTEKPMVPTERPTAPTKKSTLGIQSTMLASGTSWAPPTTRNATLTTVSCPPNAHYDFCMCPASCENPRPTCKLPCSPGCVCNQGFLLSQNNCISALSCHCFYGNRYYQPGENWLSSNCSERCHCSSGGQIDCQKAQCKTNMVCELRDNKYGCYPFGSATCVVYGALHYVTFDERHIGFTGRCTYILTQSCHNKTTEPFFRVMAENEKRGVEGVSCLSKVYMDLSTTSITLLKGRHILVEGERVTLPVMLPNNNRMSLSGRFVVLETSFGLTVRWDGDQQLFLTVTSTHSGHLCGLCGNYDGEGNNDNLKPNGGQAQNPEELGNSWQMARNESKECKKMNETAMVCDSEFVSTLSGPAFCGQLTLSNGIFEACLTNLKAASFFHNCVSDMCSYQGVQAMLCAHLSMITAICQSSGLPVQPWRGPSFCPLACPDNSKYSLCAKPCPETCLAKFTQKHCPHPCMEACECNPGFVLSGSQCIHRTQCGCLTPTGRYLKIGDVWYKPKCKELCICGSNHKFRCHSWNCTAQETCRWKDGSYGCHAIGEATCLASGDPHYLTFDGARHRFTGTCNYILSKPCWPGFLDNYFVVSATNENRGGNLEVAYIKAVHLVVFNLRISLLKGHKVTVEGHQVSLPVWLAQDRVTIRFSGNFILFYANFGLQVRYDGNHLVMVSVSSSYAGQLCGLCGNYNNNSLDDNLKPDRRPASNSSQLGASWRISEFSDPGCFVTGGGISDCKNSDTSTIWNKNCDILLNPMGPFSICHQVVAPQISFASCVRGQCESKGNALSLCNSLQAYADLCAQAGQAIAWRNSTFCPLKCLPNSSYKPCANPCPDACLSLSAPTYCPALPCVEGCECQKGYILSGRTCVPPSHCGCRDPEGFYHLVGETWYPEDTCHNLCSCWINNNITCVTTTCQANHMCSSQDGAFHCQAIGTGVCQVSEDVKYMSFDGVGQPIFGTCTHILVKVCDPSSKLPFFEINAKSESEGGGTKNFYIRRVYITVFSSHIILQNRHRVLIDGELVTLPVTKIHGVKITSSGDYTLVSVNNGVQVKYGGDHFLEIKVPAAYHKKLCGVCGNFNGQAEDDLMMPNNELIENGHDFMNSWRNHDLDPMCQSVEEEVTQVEVQETTNGKCQPADLGKIRQACQEALQTPAWAECATRVDIKPYILGCIDKLCEFGGLARGLIHTLCETLQGFETACRNEGLKTPIWRNSSFCPLECPEYSRYSNCLPSCSPSCQEPNCEGAGVRVPISCSEGCICQTDYVLNEGRCVPRSHCSCRNAQGASVPANKTWIAKGCNQRCTCTEGRIQCRSFQCPYGSHCQDGQSDNGYCIPDKSAQCTVLGDPYYRTFDGFGYHFPGRLTYILVKTVDTLPEGIESLLVEGRNKLDKASSPTLHEVIIMVYGYKVHLQTNLQLLVNGQRMDIPYVPSDELQVTLRGTRIFLITAFQLIVSYDGKDLAVINMPSTYQRLVRGLCGNYDKDKTNELTLPNGHVTQNIHVFISGWTVNPQDSLLRFPRALPEQEEGEKDAPAIRSQCSPEQLAFIHTSQACRVLVDPQGPFATCHQVMDPEPFEEHCVFDLCASQDPKEQEELRCRALSGYAIICQEAGASLVGWRNHTRCAMVCPANTVYSSCMIPCPASCANPAAASDCAGPCLEGCASLPGYIYSGTRSLPKAHCGCTAAGVYYQLGSSFVTEDCAQLCICASAGLLLCQPFGCRAGEICTLANFTRGCFQESPCLQNPCHNDGRCQEQGASFTCECDPGYGGRLCTEPRDSLSPQKPGPSSLTAILLGMLVPTLVVLPVLLVVATRECARRGLRPPGWREKPWSPDPGWLPD
ncbi:zonadhesin [Thomomys bottae]